MDSAARQMEGGTGVFQEVGVVRGGSDALVVETPSGVFPARRAFSCLVEPEEDDRVLVAVPPRGELYVLAVLERPGDGEARVALPNDLTVQLPEGRFSLAARDGVDLASGERMTLSAPDVSLRARLGHVVVDRLAYLGQSVQAHGGKLESTFGAIDQVVERVTQKAKRVYRFIEEMDVTRAREVDTRAKGNVSLRGRNALVTAEELVKMDGDQIHLG
jgi:hypothetical protein